MSRFLLGIDCGQTATKVVLFDLDGHEVAAARVPTTVRSPRPRWAERDLDRLWVEVATATREVLAGSGVPAAAVAGVGVGGHSDGAYLVDDHHRPVRAAVLATDTRAHSTAAALRAGEVGARLLELTGQVPFPASTGAVLAWLARHEPDTLGATRWALGCKDWVRLCLTGVPGTDRSEASTSFTDVTTQEWSEEALDLFGLGSVSALLPPIADSTSVVGVVTPEAAATTGLAVGTPVVAGAHDVDAATIGMGAVAAGDASVVLGTFSINQVLADAPVLDRRWQARSFVHHGQWLHMSSSPSGTVNLDWALDRFGVGSATGHRAVAEALAVPGTEGDPLFLPFLLGSPYDSDLAGALVGMRAWNDRSDLVRAVAEGIAFNHRSHVDALREGFGTLPTLRVCGGGTRSPAWSQMMADVLAAEVVVGDAGEAGALGAAVLAGVGVGEFGSVVEGAERVRRVARTHVPDPDAVARYELRHRRFRAVVDALLPISEHSDKH